MAKKKAKSSKSTSKAKAAKKVKKAAKKASKKTQAKKSVKASTKSAKKKTTKVKKASKTTASGKKKKTSKKTKKASETNKGTTARKKVKKNQASPVSDSAPVAVVNPPAEEVEPQKKKLMVQNVQPVLRKPRRQSALSLALAQAQQKKADVVDPTAPIPKTKLNKREIKKFKTLLLERRKQLVGDLDNLTGEALGKTRSDATGDLSSMPIHMADIGSDNWEKEFTLDLLDHDRQILKEIDEALERIEDNTYGICLGTHQPIGQARLMAKPWAKYCIEYAMAIESKKKGRR